MSRTERLTGGGAPLLDEPLPIELANATYAARGRLRDGLRTPEHLGAWLRDRRDRLASPLGDRDLLSVTMEDLAVARRLRDAIRALATAAVEDHRPSPRQLEALNAVARSAPRWRELRWDGAPLAETHTLAGPVNAAMTEIADTAVELFAGPRRRLLRTCHAPGCVLFFLRDHPRREWCSASCGNRARAARHYRRHQRHPSDRARRSPR
ncbi:MAG TPA: ABATE domain-containing protein [Actinomycetes bacterium]|jgi:predicted RNA-binding Zn ribbon-like protein|nr:ABATE domain-containing protein [Actinomycetes bacterium]